MKVNETSRNAEIIPINARPAVVVQDMGHSYFVDAATGEVIYASRTLPKHRKVRRVDVEVGVGTRWPSEARDATELYEATSLFDLWQSEHYVNGGKLLDLLGHGVSSNAIRLLRHLADNITARNYWFGRISDLAQTLQMPTRSLERAMQELTSINAVKRKTQGRNWPTRISVHPWYAWRGDLMPRDPAYAEWVGLRPADFGAQ
ncbi:hypothetical protein [Pseudomonas tohonis]|uniref:hypothetical protein n=1 Tax=Pseudomonas tohonis TaxID=2725477 RepID=UPI00255C1561|nr:hypothetical protein [Pseudomonas tohonis]